MSSSEFEIDHNENIAEDIADDFPSRYRHSEVLRAIVEGFGDATQELEDLIFTYLVDTTLDLSVGKQLNMWGELVGEHRGPFDDPEYRELIKARAMVNIFGNTIDEILEIYRQSTAGRKVWYFEHAPAAYRLEVLRDDWMSDERIGRVNHHIKLATTAGVSYTLVETLPSELRMNNSSQNGFGSNLSRVIS